MESSEDIVRATGPLHYGEPSMDTLKIVAAIGRLVCAIERAAAQCSKALGVP